MTDPFTGPLPHTVPLDSTHAFGFRPLRSDYRGNTTLRMPRMPMGRGYWALECRPSRRSGEEDLAPWTRNAQIAHKARGSTGEAVWCEGVPDGGTSAQVHLEGAVWRAVLVDWHVTRHDLRHATPGSLTELLFSPEPRVREVARNAVGLLPGAPVESRRRRRAV